jgi:hypothetical protein
MDELSHLGWVAQHSFELDGLLLGVRTNSREFARWLAKEMPATLVVDEEAEPNYSVLVSRKRSEFGRRFHLLYKDSTLLARTFDAAELVRALLADVEGLTYGDRHDAVYVQAAFLSLGGIDTLFPEELVGMLDPVRRRIHRMGFQLPVSRHVAIDLETSEVMPRPGALQVGGDALNGLIEAVPSEPTAWPRSELDGSATVDLVCTMGSAGTEPVVPISRGFALYVLSSNAVNLHEVGGAGVQALSRLVENAACWEISPGPPDLMARSALDLAGLIGAERTKPTVGGLQ